VLEEYFAYQTSSSKLRRYLGNCFISDMDALLFVFPALLLPVAQFLQMMFFPQLWMFPFWIIALCYPVYLFVRNHRARKLVRRARKVLLDAGIDMADAVLFRMTSNEIAELGGKRCPQDVLQYMKDKAVSELRWQVIVTRFVNMDDFGSCSEQAALESGEENNGQIEDK
jgi:hypothetical protein